MESVAFRGLDLFVFLVIHVMVVSQVANVFHVDHVLHWVCWVSPDVVSAERRLLLPQLLIKPLGIPNELLG